MSAELLNLFVMKMAKKNQNSVGILAKSFRDDKNQTCRHYLIVGVKYEVIIVLIFSM